MILHFDLDHLLMLETEQTVQTATSKQPELSWKLLDGLTKET